MLEGLESYELVEAGLVPSRPSKSAFGPWDPKGNARQPIERELQPKDIWEEMDGIHAHLDPFALLLTEPRLWPIVTRFRCGVREVTPEMYEKDSSLEISGLLELAAAHCRKPQKRPSAPRTPRPTSPRGPGPGPRSNGPARKPPMKRGRRRG